MDSGLLASLGLGMTESTLSQGRAGERQIVCSAYCWALAIAGMSDRTIPPAPGAAPGSFPRRWQSPTKWSSACAQLRNPIASRRREEVSASEERTRLEKVSLAMVSFPDRSATYSVPRSGHLRSLCKAARRPRMQFVRRLAAQVVERLVIENWGGRTLGRPPRAVDQARNIRRRQAGPPRPRIDTLRPRRPPPAAQTWAGTRSGRSRSAPLRCRSPLSPGRCTAPGR
jgi:hypothetical protein